MSVLGNLEKQLGISPVDFSDIKGVDFSTPTHTTDKPTNISNVEEPKFVVPSITQKTFGKLDMLWGCSHGTAEDLYNKLCGDLPYSTREQAQIIQKILQGMQCGTITKTKINDLVRQLVGG